MLVASGLRLMAAATRAETTPLWRNERASSKTSRGRLRPPTSSCNMASALRACRRELRLSSAIWLGCDPLVEDDSRVRS